MALGLTIIGLSALINNSPILPDAVAYDTIELFGEGIFDKMWGRNEIVDSIVIEAYDTTTYLPTWTTTTYVLADFESDLSMGNISGLTAPLDSWRVYRLDQDRSSLRFLAEVGIDVIEYKDYLPVLDKSYIYYLYAKTANELSNPLISSPITPDYYGYFLIDADNEVSYKFDLNIASGTFSTNNDWSEYGTNLQYNKYSIGQRNFVMGNITAIIRDETSNISNGLNQTLEILKSLRDFVTTSTSTKYLKTIRGEIFKVFTHDYSQSQLNDNIREQVYLSSFNFKEIGDVYDN